MAVGVGVCGGVWCAFVGVGVVHSWVECRKGGGEVVEGPFKCGAHVSDGDSDEFHPPPVFIEDCDEG